MRPKTGRKVSRKRTVQQAKRNQKPKNYKILSIGMRLAIQSPRAVLEE
jgi:hypothetical protein